MTPKVTKPVSRIYRFFIVYFPTFSETLSFLEGLVDQGEGRGAGAGNNFLPREKDVFATFCGFATSEVSGKRRVLQPPLVPLSVPLQPDS